MNYPEWEAELLSREDSNLAVWVQRFRDQQREVLHLDLHVWDPIEDPGPAPLDLDLTYAACRAGLSLVRRWAQVRGSLETEDLWISQPYLIVDQLWLEGDKAETPPHVYVCIARPASRASAVRPEQLRAVSRTGDRAFDRLLAVGDRLSITDDPHDDVPVGWIVEVP